MKIAIPIAEGLLSMHFGHAKVFKFFVVDDNTKKVLSESEKEAPAHAPGVLPKWLADEGATVILSGGMGQRAVSLFKENGIEPIVGVASRPPKEVVQDFLAGTLKAGENVCDH